MNENTKVTLDFADELRIEGVNCKGYGIIPKFVMLDRDLSIDAKGIYAYFCSFSGSGSTVFPGRDRILHDLGINKDSYYKHYKMLLDNGYITVTQENQGGQGKGFSRNVYTLVSNPKKFGDTPIDNHLNLAYSAIRSRGLSAAGYGCIAKAVMTDERLSLKGKALYAYLASFLGSGDTACPKKDTILFHLGITDKTYRKFSAELVDLNYICVVQRHVGGRLGVNDFYLNDNPNLDSVTHDRKVRVVQCGKISDTQKQDTDLEITAAPDTSIIFTPSQCGNFSDTLIQDTQKQDTQISDTINNNTITNNTYHKQSNHQQEQVCSEEEEMRAALLSAGTLPKTILRSKAKLDTALKVLTDFTNLGDKEKYPKDAAGEASYKNYLLFFEALKTLLLTKNPINLQGEAVSADDVYERLLPYIKKTTVPEALAEILGRAAGDTLYLDLIQDVAIEAYRKGSSATSVLNPIAYMKACIWNALKLGENALESPIEITY